MSDKTNIKTPTAAELKEAVKTVSSAEQQAATEAEAAEKKAKAEADAAAKAEAEAEKAAKARAKLEAKKHRERAKNEGFADQLRDTVNFITMNSGFGADHVLTGLKGMAKDLKASVAEGYDTVTIYGLDARGETMAEALSNWCNKARRRLNELG